MVYLNSGPRRYGDAPVRCYARGIFEFQCVLNGSARPSLPEGAPLEGPSPCLWLFDRSFRHGWIDEPGRESEVLVMHVQHLPPGMAPLLSGPGRLRTPLRRGDLQTLRADWETLKPHARQRSNHTDVVVNAVKARLCHLLLSVVPEVRQEPDEAYAAWKVEQALCWYRERVERAPSVESVARAVYVSPTHLRRLFAKVQSRSPHAAFHELRMAHAHTLVRGSSLPLAEIAGRLNFSEPSAFSRAYRQTFGCSPRQRREQPVSDDRKPL